MATTKPRALRINEDVWKAAVTAAESDGTTVTALVESHLAEYVGLAAPERRPGRPRKNLAPSMEACQICGTRRPDLVLDHCHVHDASRGRICRRCNRAMSYVDSGIRPHSVLRDGFAPLQGYINHALLCPLCPPVNESTLCAVTSLPAVSRQPRPELQPAVNPPPVRAPKYLAMAVQDRLDSAGSSTMVTVRVQPGDRVNSAVSLFLRALLDATEG